MRWLVWKKAWSLAAKAFPSKRIWVDVPFRIGRAGSMGVYDLAATKDSIGAIKYETVVRNGKTTVSMRLGDEVVDATLPRQRPRSLRTARAEILRPVEAKEPVVAFRPRFHVNQRVRVNDNSMEYGELATILDIFEENKGREYLVLVDGSEKPVIMHETNLKPNMVGAVSEDDE